MYYTELYQLDHFCFVLILMNAGHFLLRNGCSPTKVRYRYPSVVCPSDISLSMMLNEVLWSSPYRFEYIKVITHNLAILSKGKSQTFAWNMSGMSCLFTAENVQYL